MVEEMPWTQTRIWTTSGGFALAASAVGALIGGAKWIMPCFVVVAMVALWVLERFAGKANAAAAEQAVVAREVAADRALAEQAALERSAAEQDARDAAVAQAASAARESERARVAAAEQFAEQVLFDDLVQEAHTIMNTGGTARGA